MTPLEKLSERERGQSQWLKDNPPKADPNSYLDNGTDARWFWHYGYCVALRDAIKLLSN